MQSYIPSATSVPMTFMMGHTHNMQPVELPVPPNELHSKLCILANIGSMEAWGTVSESSDRPLQDCNFAFFPKLGWEARNLQF